MCEDRDIIIEMFIKWIEMDKPCNVYLNTTGGKLTMKQVLEQMEKGIGFGKKLKFQISLKCLNHSNHFSDLPEQTKESLVIIFIRETINKIKAS